MLSFSLLIWNLVVFVTYGIDKGKARKGAWRIPEKTLLGMALGLGGIGAYFGGKFFHHKTKKWYFKLFWALGWIVDGLVIYLIWR